MLEFNKSEYEILENCPWCNSPNFSFLYKGKFENEVVKCNKCNLVFSKKRLNKAGLNKYWKNYLSNIHLAQEQLVQKRKIMYRLEFDLINNFMNKNVNSKVLDVGCGSGQFLDLFNDNGYKCYGVEFGEEAAKAASLKYKIWQGEFPKLDIDEKFELIIFRGVMQYLPDPVNYLEKAISILNKGGYIYITSTPNMDSFCFKLFQDKFILPVTITDFIGFSPKHFIDYFNYKGLKKLIEYYFYEETPYADVENDILMVAKAIKLKNSNCKIEFKSPSFWGNMMTLIFQK